MAKVKGNIVTEGITGMIGKQIVFKTRRGTRYVAAAPATDKKRKPTPAQKRIQERMLESHRYAKEAIRDPEIKAGYAAVANDRQSAVNVAFQDAWHPPVVNSITTNGYKGNAGDIIFVNATDNFKVITVKISIFDLKGILIEEGDAVYNGSIWIYTALHDADQAHKIIAAAYDLPGNKGEMAIFI